jgi:hypothetical protein
MASCHGLVKSSRLGLTMKTGTLVLVGLAISLTNARAHVSDTGQDYSQYLQHNGGLCCTNRDCRPVRYEFTRDGRLIMFPMGRRLEIDPSLINEKPSTDGNAHWCGRLSPYGWLETFCAILPPGNARQQPAPSRLEFGFDIGSEIGRHPPGVWVRPPNLCAFPIFWRPFR